MSVAMIPMAVEFGWSAAQQGQIQSAFLFGYTSTQVLGGALADKFGGKRTLQGTVLASALCTAAVPFAVALHATTIAQALGASALGLLISCRLLLGAAEGALLPSMNALVANYAPRARKAEALSVSFVGFQLGNVVGLFFSRLLIGPLGWRGAFMAIAAMAAPAVLLAQLGIPDKPPRHLRGQNDPAKLPQPAAKPVSKATEQPPAPGLPKFGVVSAMTNLPLIAIVLVNMVNNWCYFVYLAWMPNYFAKVFQLSVQNSALLSMLPWLTMATGTMTSGLLADALIRRGLRTVHVRKAFQAIAFCLSSLCLFILIAAPLHPTAAALVLAAAMGCKSLGYAGFAANITDIAPRQAGRVFGLCNMFGGCAGIAGVTVSGWLLDAGAGYTAVFGFMITAYLLAAAVWVGLCSDKPQFA